MRLFEITQPVLRSDILQAMASTKERIMNVEKRLSYVIVARLLEQALADWGVSFDVIKDDRLPDGEISIGGAYRPELDQDDAPDPIQLKIIHAPGDNYLGDDPEDREAFYRVVTDYLSGTLVHELIHMNQYRARGFNVGGKTKYKSKADDADLRQAQEYFGDKDELEAYAYNIADELLQKYSKDKAIEILKHDHPLPYLHKVAPVLYSHLVIFGNDRTQPVTRRLLKKTIQYINIISSQNKV